MPSSPSSPSAAAADPLAVLFAVRERLGEEEFLLYEFLLRKVPGVTLDQAARIVGTEEFAERLLRSLSRRGLVRSAEFLLRRADLRAGPLFDSRAEGELFPGRARALERAHKERLTSPRTERVWFSGERFRRPMQCSHELGVTEMYIESLERYRGAQFLGERELPQRGGGGRRAPHRVADVMLVLPGGLELALDFAPYRAGKLRELVRHHLESGRDVLLF